MQRISLELTQGDICKQTFVMDCCAQWRTEGGGGVGVFKPPRNSEGPPKLCQTQPDLRKLLKIAEFRMPTPQDVREKKGSKILKLPRFAIVLH